MKISERKLNRPLIKITNQAKEYLNLSRKIALMIVGGANVEDYLPLLRDVRLMSIDDKELLKGDICVNLYLECLSELKNKSKCTIPLEMRGKCSRLTKEQLKKARVLLKKHIWKEVADVMGLTPQGLRIAMKREKIIR